MCVGMIVQRLFLLAAALLCSVVKGESSVANFRWGRPRLPPSPRVQRGKPTAPSGTTSAPRRQFPSAQELPSRAANATRVLLPFVPLFAELPAFTAHARAAWPWARARAATAAATAFSRQPFTFIPPLTPCRSLRQQPQHAVTPRYPVWLTWNGSRRIQRGNYALRSAPMAGIITAGGFPSSTLGGDNSCDYTIVGRCSEGQTAPPAGSSCTIPSPLTFSSTNDGASPLTRLGAIRATLSLATRWVAGAAVAGSLLAGSGPAAVYADGVGGELEAEGGGGGEGGDGFGSKAFTMKSYDGFADRYDDLDGGWAASAIGTEELRAQLLTRATGRVLEVGVGTGLNLRHYRRDSVSAIEAVDLSPGMLRQASSRIESLRMKGLVKLSAMDVEHLEFPSRTFDTVVDTFSLCVFSDPSAALREMARVCKQGGRVLLLENSKSEFGPLAAYQDLTASYLANKGGAKGCLWNQDVEALCRGAGLTVVRSSPALLGGLFRTLECVPAGEP